MNRRSFIKLLSCIPALPLIGTLAPEQSPEPTKTKFTPDLTKYHQRELLKGAKPLVRFRRYSDFKVNTKPLCEGVTPTSRSLGSAEYFFVSSEELNRNWIQRLNIAKGVKK